MPYFTKVIFLLELQSQAQLEPTRTDIDVAQTGNRGQIRGNHPEVRGGQKGHRWRLEIRVVKEIEEVNGEIHFDCFSQPRLLAR